MANYGFLSVLEEELDKHFTYDYALDWNKKNHAVELTFIIEAQNKDKIETIDAAGQLNAEDIVFEDYVLFYDEDKSRFDEADYLVCLPFSAKKGFSREFLAYFATFLNDRVSEGLDDLMDFLVDPEAEDFALTWDAIDFENGRTKLKETTSYPYPRY